jgi:uncharacterized protein
MAPDFPLRFMPLEPEPLSLGTDHIPAILVRPAAPGQHPAAVLQHGFGSQKSDFLPLALVLASLGFVVLLADAWAHGDRRLTSAPAETAEARALHDMTVVHRTIDDMRVAVEALMHRPDVRGDAVIVGGFSMGAICALVVGAEDPRVAGIVSIAGSPLPDVLSMRLGAVSHTADEARRFARLHDVAAKGAALAPRPLLLSHGRNDDMVPVGGTLRLFEAVSPSYAATPDRLALKLYDHTHRITEQQLRDGLAFIAPFFLPTPAAG